MLRLLGKYIVLSAIITSLTGFPLSNVFSSELEVSGWIPYWKTKEGIKETKSHLDELTEIHPFGYTIKQDGTLNDLAGIKSSSWKRLFKSAKSQKVKVLPSVMTSNGALIHRLLSDAETRQDHIEEIVKIVNKGKYDGVDIDYEGKLAETKDYFSLFLKELKEELNGKYLTCTIEARTPPTSLYTVVPANIEYANDYAQIGTHCDRVKIMTYDQGRADVKLNSARKGNPYMPIADIEWVRKVVELTVKTIPREKLVLGIPTYGYEYEVTVSPNWFKSYGKVWSLSYEYFENTADEFDVTPYHGPSGESVYAYQATTSPYKFSSKLSIPKSTPEGLKVAQRALAHANKTGETVTFNYVVINDAESIEQKINLAKEFGLAGVALFKFDGNVQEEVWELFEN